MTVTPILFWIFLGQFSFCFLVFCACFACGSASELKYIDPVYCGCLVFVFLCVCRSFFLLSMLFIHTCVLCWFPYPICTSHVAYLCLIFGAIVMCFVRGLCLVLWKFIVSLGCVQSTIVCILDMDPGVGSSLAL